MQANNMVEEQQNLLNSRNGIGLNMSNISGIENKPDDGRMLDTSVKLSDNSQLI